MCYTLPEGRVMHMKNPMGLERRIQLNIRIDREDKEQLERIAFKERKSTSEYIRDMLHEHVRQYNIEERANKKND